MPAFALSEKLDCIVPWFHVVIWFADEIFETSLFLFFRGMYLFSLFVVPLEPRQSVTGCVYAGFRLNYVNALSYMIFGL